MPRRSFEEQIAAAEEKLQKEQARLKELKAKKRTADAAKERKERAHRLIQIGAICEDVYGDKITEGAMQNALRQFLKDQDSRGNFYSGSLNKAKTQEEL